MAIIKRRFSAFIKCAMLSILFVAVALFITSCSDDSDDSDDGENKGKDLVTYVYEVDTPSGKQKSKFIFDKNSKNVDYVMQDGDNEPTTISTTYIGNLKENAAIRVTITVGEQSIIYEGSVTTGCASILFTVGEGTALYVKESATSDDNDDDNNDGGDDNDDKEGVYTIAFDSNAPVGSDGVVSVTGTMSAQSFNAGEEKAITSCGYSIIGYEFLGWGESSYGRVVYQDGAKVTLTKSIKLYAMWEKTTDIITITFDGNGGTATGSLTTVTQKISKNSTSAKLMPNTFTYDGHVFLGWSALSTSESPSYKDEGTFWVESDSRDITLYAIWREGDVSEIIITYKAGPYSSDDSSTQKVSIDSDGAKLNRNTFTKEGYTFDGWNTSSFGDKLFDDEYLIDWSKDTFKKDITLYACWKSNTPGKVLITFHGRGGVTSDGKETVIQAANPNSTVTLDANTFSRDGYIFMGWSPYSYPSSTLYSDGDDNYKTNSYDSDLYALWLKAITITFHGNGGVTSDGKNTTTQVVPDGTSTILDANPFTRGEKSFIGWALTSTGSNQYSDGYEYSANKDVDLYACWMDGVKVTFTANTGVGSDVVITPKSKGDGTFEFTAPDCTFTKSGYVFMGWCTSSSCSDITDVTAIKRFNIYVSGDKITVSQGKIYYASWIKNTLMLKYYGYSKSCYHSGFMECNEPNTPEEKEFTFSGSDLSIAGSTSSFRYYEIQKHITLDAQAPSFLEGSSKAAYGFYGWTEYDMSAEDGHFSSFSTCANAESVGSVYSMGASYVLKNNTTLYPVYLPIDATDAYCVTYNNNSGGVNNHTNYIMVKKTVGRHKILEKYPDWKHGTTGGGTFKGWALTKDAKTAQYAAGDSITISDDITIYAVWQ